MMWSRCIAALFLSCLGTPDPDMVLEDYYVYLNGKSSAGLESEVLVEQTKALVALPMIASHFHDGMIVLRFYPGWGSCVEWNAACTGSFAGIARANETVLYYGGDPTITLSRTAFAHELGHVLLMRAYPGIKAVDQEVVLRKAGL